MNRRRHGLIVLGLTIVLLVSFGLARQGIGAELVPMITPPPGGGAYVLGAGIVTVTNKYLTDVKLVHEASTGTLDGFRRMMIRESQKKACFGLFGTGDAWNAYKGLAEYADKPFTAVRAVVINNRTDLYLVVPGNSPIKSWADTRGKRIGMGGPGSSIANTGHIIFDYYGVTKKDFKPYYYTYRETVEGIQDGSLDGGILAGGYPIAAYSELSSRHNVRIVPVDDKIAAKINADHPYLFRNVVKAKSYKGVEQDVPIIGLTGTVETVASASPEFIYMFIKNLFEHRDEYYSIHPGAKVMTPETAMEGIPIPFHPGAERYYREIGVWKK
jgi:uncharacterized protein